MSFLGSSPFSFYLFFCCCYFCCFSRKLNCGRHNCTQICHPQPCQLCPRLPQVVYRCPCGQTPLSKLLELGCVERKICTDPIPSCGKTCGKPLSCGSYGNQIFLHQNIMNSHLKRKRNLFHFWNILLVIWVLTNWVRETVLIQSYTSKWVNVFV